MRCIDPQLLYLSRWRDIVAVDPRHRSLLLLPRYPLLTFFSVVSLFQKNFPPRRYSVLRMHKEKVLGRLRIWRPQHQSSVFVVPFQARIYNCFWKPKALMPVADQHGVEVTANLCLAATYLDSPPCDRAQRP